MSENTAEVWCCDVCGHEWLKGETKPTHCASSKCRSRKWNAGKQAEKPRKGDWRAQLLAEPHRSCSGDVLIERLAAVAEGGERYREFLRVEAEAHARAEAKGKRKAQPERTVELNREEGTDCYEVVYLLDGEVQGVLEYAHQGRWPQMQDDIDGWRMRGVAPAEAAL